MVHGVGLEPTTPCSSSIRSLQFRFMSKPNYYCALPTAPSVLIKMREVGLEPTTPGLTDQIINIAASDFIKSPL